MPIGTQSIPVNVHRTGLKAQTVATFSWDERQEMFNYIDQMNSLGIGHFAMATKPTQDWDEEALIDELMQPRRHEFPYTYRIPAIPGN